jgi:hypothetical protein
MPHASFKVIPGVDQNKTPTLNEAALSSCQLIRFMPDRSGLGLVQKLGGWTQFPSNSVSLPAIARALCAWEDTNGFTHLAYGAQSTGSGSAALGVITNGNIQNVTPRNTTNSSATLSVSATSGSSYVQITDATITGITYYDSVYIATPIAIAGIVLFGLYACDPNGYVGATTYTVQAKDVLGNPILANATTTTAQTPNITTTVSSSIASVNLPSHGYSVGSTFTVLTSTTVVGAVFYGQYLVTTITDANNFTISSTTTPSASTSGYVNGGNAYYIYNFGVGSIPAGTGYGIGGYGRGGYGTGTAVVPGTGTAISATDWTLDNWGEVLLSSPIYPSAVPFQPIYAWDPLSGSPTSTIISDAPPVNDGFFVAMPQRQIVAWGSTFDGVQDPLLVRWCDIGNYNSWVGTVTNQAGSYRIPKGARLVGGIQGPQQALLWTDLGVWAMQYISLPYVYGFNELGSGCGLIARKAAGILSGTVFWMGPSQFFALTANGVETIPCPVWDVIFQDLDQTNLQKIRVAVNSRFGEISWYYPTISGGGEVNAYVKYNSHLGAWDFGSLGRTAWVDQSVLGPPIGADPTSLVLYQHETSTDAAGQPLNASFQTGWFTIGDGENMTYVDQVWPDMKWGYYGGTQSATVNLTFYVADYPEQTPRVFGPYPVTSSSTFISPRFRGRLVSLGVSSNDVGSFWRLGGIRYQFKPDGRY